MQTNTTATAMPINPPAAVCPGCGKHLPIAEPQLGNECTTACHCGAAMVWPPDLDPVVPPCVFISKPAKA